MSSETMPLAGPSKTRPQPVRINSIVHLLHPVASTTPDSSRSPSLILIFGWFKAAIPHVAKYAEIFHSFYPSSTIALVQIDESWLYSSQHAREKLLVPVADLLERMLSDKQAPFRGLFLHAMSNGGLMQLHVLSKLLFKRPRQHTNPYPVALAIDSAPESNSMRCMVVAFTATMTNPVVKFMVTPVLAFLYSLFHISYGHPSVLTDLRRRLNNSPIVPWDDTMLASDVGPEKQPGQSAETNLYADPRTNFHDPMVNIEDMKKTPRLYICSRADPITRYSAVEQHFKEANKAGFDTRTLVFENTGHVSHAKAYPEIYWGAVQELWKDAREKVPIHAKL